MSQKDSTVSEEGNKLIDFRWTRIESKFSLSETWKEIFCRPLPLLQNTTSLQRWIFLRLLHFPKLPPPFLREDIEDKFPYDLTPSFEI